MSGRLYGWQKIGLSTSLTTVVALIIGGLAVASAGCGNIEPVAPYEQLVADPAKLYTRLAFEDPAVNLSTDTTVASYYRFQLTATPRDALGNPMTGLPAPFFHLLNPTDSTLVRLTPDGLVTALNVATDGVRVIAELTVGTIRHADTATVVVRNVTNPPRLDSLVIDPASPDSAVLSLATPNEVGFLVLAGVGLVPDDPVVVPRAFDTAGNSIASLAFDYISLDPAILTVERKDELAAHRPGKARVVARTHAYGVSRTDTVTYTVTLPVGRDFYAKSGATTGIPAFTTVYGGTSEVRIAPYGMVFWVNSLDDSVDVVFDDPTKAGMPPAALCDLLPFFLPPDEYCGTGDILMPAMPDFHLLTMRIRQFTEPGVYPFHSNRTGASGRVVVANSLD